MTATFSPVVSIILPTFNRSRFLEAVFDSIRAQAMASYEVIVVDDGSTDSTREQIEALSSSLDAPIRYIYQDNKGAYGARNTGVANASGRFIAFYDSDDVWLPHHLPNCVEALERNDDVDWVYSASEIIELDTGRTLDPNCFYQGNVPRPFMRLRHERRGALHVVVDPAAIACQIRDGLYCGFQNSVIRRRVFERLRLSDQPRNEAEDQLFAIRALASGFRLAYFDAVHVKYHVHSENSSATTRNTSLEKQRRVYEPLIEGYRKLEGEVQLTPKERRALRKRLGVELFWHLGYAGYWAAGEKTQALQKYREALRLWPWSLRQWKTFTLAVMRTAVGRDTSTPKAR